MLRRRVVGRAVVRTAAVGGVAYAAGHHVGGMTTEKMEQLKQLGQLHESGILTDAEFDAEKQKILNSY